MGAMVEDYGLPLNEQRTIIVFSLSAALGALVVFVGYVRLAGLIINKMQWATRYTDRAVGLVFFGLMIFQLVGLLT